MIDPTSPLTHGATWLSATTAALLGAPTWLIALLITAVLVHNVFIEWMRCRRDVAVARANQSPARDAGRSDPPTGEDPEPQGEEPN